MSVCSQNFWSYVLKDSDLIDIKFLLDFSKYVERKKKKIETDLLDTNEFTLQRDTITFLKWKRSQFAS